MTSLDARKKSDARQRTALANVRLLPSEHDAIKDTARREGISIGEVLRRALVATRAI